MASRDSWIDVDELAELGRQLVAPQRRLVQDLGWEAGVDAGDPPTEVIGRWKRQLAEIRERAERSGLVGDVCLAPADSWSAPAPDHDPVPFVPPPDAPLVARMRAFGDWLRASVRPLACFGADDAGFAILGGDPDPALAAAALALCRAWHAAGVGATGAPAAMASRVIEGRGILSVFPITGSGAFRFVALLSVAPLASEAAERIGAAFRAAMGHPCL